MLFDSGGEEKAWDARLQLLLVAIIAFNVLPHMASIPIWTTAVAFLFLTWKTVSLLRGLPRPPRWFLYVVSFVCSVGIFFEYHTIIGQEPASALLVTLASAKLLETNRYRDAMFVIFTAFFLLMAHLLDSQTILTTIYMALDVMLITALMFSLHKQERRQSVRAFRPVMKTLLLAIPVWIFLFIVFPRFSSQFGGGDRDSRPGGGFAEDLDPGGLETLVESEDPAFHVTFEGHAPSMSDLYWRGGILTVGNGLKWTKAKERSLGADIVVPAEKTTSAVSYEVYLESRFQSWIFALDYPVSLTAHQQGLPSLRKRPGFIYENIRTGGGQSVYDGESARISQPQRLLNEDRAKMLQLPDDLDPRVRELAARLAHEASALPLSARFPTYADQLAFHVEQWYDEQGFRYTKSPGALEAKTGSGQLSEFLFEKKRGFCEHYASSFATLMRAAGIPARVTVGFLGASKNLYSNYYIVRDLDAHAWAEIWRDDPSKKGVGRWVRVDPTELIAPLRLQLGGDFNLLDPSSYQKGLTQAEAELRLGFRKSQLYYRASLAWDALQMKWNSFLSDYDFDFQKSFLEKLGFHGITRWFLLSVASGGILLFVLGLTLFLRRRAHKIDPVLMSWRKLCKKLDRAGVARRNNEGPMTFTARAAQRFPVASGSLLALGEQYSSLRYGPPDGSGASSLKEFRRSVRQLKLTADEARAETDKR